jgi:hypothetical protein
MTDRIVLRCPYCQINMFRKYKKKHIYSKQHNKNIVRIELLWKNITMLS